MGAGAGVRVEGGGAAEDERDGGRLAFCSLTASCGFWRFMEGVQRYRAKRGLFSTLIVWFLLLNFELLSLSLSLALSPSLARCLSVSTLSRLSSSFLLLID